MTLAMGHARHERRLEAAKRAYRERFGEDASVALHGPPAFCRRADEGGGARRATDHWCPSGVAGRPTLRVLEWTMTQHNLPTALTAAEEAYRAKFGEYAPVWGFLAHPRLADELLAAVKRGEKLTADMLGGG